MRKLFILLLASACILSLRAERVNLRTAQQIAENLISTKTTLRTSVLEELSLAYVAYSGGVSSVLRSTPASVDADFYVFNVGKNSGFIIVAGEDRIRPVLGYAVEGHLDEAHMPDNMKSWLKHYQEEIEYVVGKNAVATASITEEWNSLLKSSANVSPKVLLRTAVWGQDDPFNRKCPTINGKQAVTGCVATAQAIVMQYYQYPKRTVGGVSSYMGIPITYDEYDWDNILPEYKEEQPGYAPYYTGYQADCMANLIWHCGANVGMVYGVEESSASLASSAAALQNVFGYSKQIRYISKLAPSGGDAYSWTDWMNILRGELDNNRLVLYDGQTAEKIDPFNGRGHAFVCDGYADGDLFHINWGWSGYLNGYFLLTTLDPYGDNKGYSERPGMIINIKPDDESENVADLYLGQSVQCAYLPFTINQPVIAYFTYANKGNVPFEGYANFVIVDGKDNSIKKILQEQNEPISVGIESDQTIDYPCLLRFTEPLPADYYVMAAYSSDGKDWKLLQGLTPDIASKLSWQGPVAEGSISYKVELDCRGGGLKLDMPDKVEYNQPLTLTLSANSGYKLPAKDRLSIQMARIDMSGYAASDEIHSNHYYILDLSDAQTAKITIPCVTGNIWIAAEGIQLDTQDDASLQFLSYDVAGVVSNIQLMQNEQSYTIELPDNTPDGTEISLNAVAKQNEATVEITNASLSDGKATARVKVVAGDGITSITYEVHFIAKQSSEIINGVLKYQIAGENVVRVTAPNAPSPDAWTVTDCVIPETIELNNETYRVTGIGTEAFANCRSLTSITLPSGLNAIGERAFAGCSGSLKSIHCQNPEPVAFPLLFFHATMDERANSPSVYDCILYVPAGSKDRYAQAEGWKDFGGIMVEGEVIEPDTQDDASLQHLSYSVRGAVFSIQLMQNEQSYTIELPDNTPDGTEISLDAVAKQNEATVEITNAFLSDGKATARVKVVAGDGITSITYEVHFIAKQSSEIISGVLKYQIAGENVVRVTAPNAPSPDAWTVTDCVIPEMIELNNETYRVTGIGTKAFANCRSLTSITLPSGLNAIGERAFAGCSGSLKSIHCQNPEPVAFPLLFFHATMDERANSPSVYDCILYVPAGSKDRYTQAEGWKDFGGIMVEGEVIELSVGEVTDSTTAVVWNTFEQATGYILKVYENAEKTKLKVEYKFDADGQLLRSSTFAFNIDGLLPGHIYYIETLAIREGFFATPIILSQSTVEVKTSGTVTGITDIHDNELSLYGSNGCIHISSAGTVAVKIYDLSGKCVWNKTVEGYEQIRLPRKAYIVIINDMNHKNSLKKQIVII